MNLDDLELELRKLPGIGWATFSDLGDRLVVQLHAIAGARSDVSLEASRIAARHSEVPVAIDLVRWLPPPSPVEHPVLHSNGAASATPRGAVGATAPAGAPTPSATTAPAVFASMPSSPPPVPPPPSAWSTSLAAPPFVAREAMAKT